MLQLGVLYKQKKKDIGDNVFIQKVLKSNSFFLDRIIGIELMFKKFNCFRRQSNFKRSAGIYDSIIVRGGEKITYSIKIQCFDADVPVDVWVCIAGRKVVEVMGAKQVERIGFQNFFLAIDIMDHLSGNNVKDLYKFMLVILIISRIG